MDLEKRFTYHKPDVTKIGHYKMIRDCAKTYARVILHNVPDCRERSLAITKLEEVVMWANAGIARNEIDEF